MVDSTEKKKKRTEQNRKEKKRKEKKRREFPKDKKKSKRKSGIGGTNIRVLCKQIAECGDDRKRTEERQKGGQKLQNSHSER